jgi:ergothioneine biosynthesis protein EgtB
VLYNSYYNSIGAKYPRAQRGLVSRPSLAQVLRYRAAVDERVQAVLATRGGDPSLAKLVTLGLQHEQQHQELLLTDIKHALSFNAPQGAYAQRWPLASTAPEPVRWHAYPAGLADHGFDAAQDGGFAFDNETPRRRCYVHPFELASRLVTNGEFMAFIADGGYQRPEWWLAMGWDWVQSSPAGPRRMPLYWEADGENFRNFTLQGNVRVDPNTPVCHTSFFEADAFARWSGARLPTEVEWELAARAASVVTAATESQGTAGNFVESNTFHPLPLQAPPASSPAQMFGDVWEWTASNYNPYPGYQPWAGLVGEYNGKFMCNQFVLKGGSCVTPHSHIRASYRNFFPPEAQWQFSGLRLARDVVVD